MKISIDVDLSPEELRRLFGLPDFTPAQNLIVEALNRQIEKGLDGSLLPSMMRAVVEGGMQSFEAYQKLVTNLVSPGRGGVGGGGEGAEADTEKRGSRD